jgi:hypothetical protein
MSQTSGERCSLLVPMRRRHTGDDLSRPNHINPCAVRPVDAIRMPDEMPTALSRPSWRADKQLASCRRAAHIDLRADIKSP